MNYIFKYTKVNLEFLPNDVDIQIVGYLVDSNNNAFIDPNNQKLDTFIVQAYKSSLPASGYESYLSIMANKAITEKYNSTFGGQTVTNSKQITRISDTQYIVPSLIITGNGIPNNTAVLSVRDKNSISISNPATATNQVTFNLSANGWSIDYSEIQNIVNIIDFSAI